MRELLKASVVVVIVRALGIVLQSIIVIMLARALPVPEMGVFALCYALLGFARMLGPLGAGQSTMRLVARALEHSPIDDGIHRLLNASALMVLAINVAIAALLAGVGLLAGDIFGDAPDADWALVWSAVAIPAFAIIGLFTLQLRGFGQQVWAQVPDSIILQIAFGAILLLLGASGALSLGTAVLALAVAAWVVAAIYVYSRVKLGVRRLWPTFADCRNLMAEAWDILAALTVTAMAVRAPLFIAAWTLGPAAAAILDIATRFGTLPSIVTTSVMATFSPRFAALSGPSQRKELSRTLSFASVVAIAPALATLGVIAAVGPFLISSVLPEIYRQSFVPMLIICAGQVVNAWMGPSTNLLLMIGRGAIVRNASALQLALVVGGSLLVAVWGGVIEIALVILAAQLVRDGSATLWVTRKLSMAFPPLSLLRH